MVLVTAGYEIVIRRTMMMMMMRRRRRRIMMIMPELVLLLLLFAAGVGKCDEDHRKNTMCTCFLYTDEEGAPCLVSLGFCCRCSTGQRQVSL